jgi:ABC-type transport system involved in multi-copper enzyme maturation permease subunit
VKVRTIALNTFGTFLHNKVIVVLCLLFVCSFLMGLYSVLSFKSMTTPSNAQQMQSLMLDDVGKTMFLLSGLGSLLAAWAAAAAVADEMKSGTILAVMARPLRRWQFLTGKYLGVLMLMSVYALGMLGVMFLLTWLGGQPFRTPWWVLLAYPLVRYAIWAAISIFLVTLLNPAVVMGMVAVLLALIQLLVTASALSDIPSWFRLPLHLALPLTTVVLSETRFLTMTRASLERYPWTDHVAALAYGLDYALVWFLLAVAMFHYRSLSRD